MKYHLIGNMGVSMSALSEILKSSGHIVTGSDIKSGGHSSNNIDESIDVVVRNSAINEGSEGWVEVEAAEKLGIKVMKRSELIGEITKNKKLIAISGMHGKTTTTSLVGLALIKANFDPTVMVGEKIDDFGNKAYAIGQSDYFVLEACEYDRSFLDFFPEMIILTNIDEEHLDTYPGGIEEIKQAFTEYIKNLKDGGTVIANYEDNNIREVLKNPIFKSLDIAWYGKGTEYDEIRHEMKLIGEHNKLNALAMEVACLKLGVGSEVVADVLINFGGAKRRLESWGEYKQATVYDDYGHHPTEIKATIAALKEKYPERKLNVIFWPHQYKRIAPLIDQFSESFTGAENVYIKKIFFVPGRDEPLNVSSEDLAKKINHANAKAFEEDEEILSEVRKSAEEKSVILTMGIPPIYEIIPKIRKA